MARMTDKARRALVEDRQAQILAAAVKVFGKKGFERATIRDIAKQAHVSEGSIYNYFKNKNDLLVSIPTQVVNPVVESLKLEMFQRDSGEPVSPAEALSEIAHRMVSTFRAKGEVFRILLSALPTMNQASREKYAEQVVMFVARALESFFAAKIEKGVFRPDLDPAIAARTFIGMFFPFVMLQDVLRIGGSEFDYEQVIAQAVQLFLHGTLAGAQEEKHR